ncbi:hypothetical protein [Microbacterium sp. R86528]|uniref:hypothetical protein n=1 Tax=Microbacterium sp. R86528 TaxID=3093864 RepID=UPI0037C6C776
MQWTADTSAGDWLRDRIDDPWAATMHDMVPRGFESYTRIFHGASKSKPIDDTWPALPYEQHRDAWEAFSARQPEIETVAAGWGDAAAAFGTHMHANAQWGTIVRVPDTDPNLWGQVNAPNGWRFDAPPVGKLDTALVSVVAALAATHTTTPDDAFVGLWEGWAGLVGAVGYGPARGFYTINDETSDSKKAHRWTSLVEATRNGWLRKTSWQPGMLSDEISRGPRFSLLNRDFVLFRSALAELANPDWVLSVPWRDRESEAHGLEPSAQSPNIIWPADRSWVIVSEIDWDSTIVAGPHSLAQALRDDPRLETFSVREGASLQWDADGVNR